MRNVGRVICPVTGPMPLGKRDAFSRVEFLEPPDSQRPSSRAKTEQDHPSCWTSLPCTSSGYWEANSCPRQVASWAQRAVEGAGHAGSLFLGQSSSCGSPGAPLTSGPSQQLSSGRPVPTGLRAAPPTAPGQHGVPCPSQHLLSAA